MTDWKMPEWMREVFIKLGYQSPDGTLDAVEALLNKSAHGTRQGEYWRGIKDFATDARESRLLSTPTERDAQNKRIAELGKEVEGFKRNILAKSPFEVELLETDKNCSKCGAVLYVCKEAHDED